MKQIIALDGGGFSMEPENPLLDEYVLAQVEKDRLKICFLPTANGDSEDYMERFYDFFQKKNCEPTHLSLFSPSSRDLRECFGVRYYICGRRCHEKYACIVEGKGS